MEGVWGLMPGHFPEVVKRVMAGIALMDGVKK